MRLSPGLYDSAHESYLVASQGPLINIYLPDININYRAKQVFENNIFHRNRHHYTLVEEKTYQASLIVIKSELADAEFTFKGNKVEYNSFVGEETALISISGPPIMKIQNNQFMANGKLSSEGNPQQGRGVFSFVFDRDFTPVSHKITDNTFSHIFCVKGCAYSVTGSYPEQLVFQRNTYAYMAARDHGAVFDCSKFEYRGDDLMMFFFDSETIEYTEGGALNLKNLNDIGVTVVSNSVFFESYEPNPAMKPRFQEPMGAAIELDHGGTLLAYNNKFSMRSQDHEWIKNVNGLLS